MNVRQMFASGSGREAKDPAGVGVLVDQTTRGKPIEYPIKGDPVYGQRTERLLDLAVRQCSRRGAKQVQNPDTRRRRTRSGATNVFGDSIRVKDVKR